MTPKSSDFEFWTIKYQKGNGLPPPPNPNYAPKTRLAEVFKTNPVISLFDCQASHEHADDLWACHANPLHRGRIITTRHTRWPSAKREGHDKPWKEGVTSPAAGRPDNQKGFWQDLSWRLHQTCFGRVVGVWGKASTALFFGSTLYCLQSAFSLKIRRVLISASAIANHDFTLQ